LVLKRLTGYAQVNGGALRPSGDNPITGPILENIVLFDK